MSDPSFRKACGAVGQLIQARDTPAWLTDYFEYWATPLASEWSIAGLQPTKKVMKLQLTAIYEGANQLSDALGDPVVVAFIERAHGIHLSEKVTELRGALNLVCKYAHDASISPELSDRAGKTRSGRGKAPVQGSMGAKTLCALIVAEAWKSVHGVYPAPRNVKAAKAAMAFWEVPGGTPIIGWGNDRTGAWRPYFEKAKAPDLEATRAECSRILGAVKPGQP